MLHAMLEGNAPAPVEGSPLTIQTVTAVSDTVVAVFLRDVYTDAFLEK